MIFSLVVLFLTETFFIPKNSKARDKKPEIKTTNETTEKRNKKFQVNTVIKSKKNYITIFNILQQIVFELIEAVFF